MIEIPKHIRHLSFLKCKPNSKIPIEKGWTYNPKTYEQVQDHIKSNNNYGVVCGYNGTLIIDFDSNKETGINGEENFYDFIEFAPKTFTVKTPGKGFHVYFKCDDWDFGSSKLSDEEGKHIGELRYFGNQTIGPNCIHPDTLTKYEIFEDLPITEIDSKELLSLLLKYKINYKQEKSELLCECAGSPGDISKVIESLALRQDQSGELKGSHPVHGSKTNNNFSVNIEKGCWHCFRCGTGGYALQLIAVLEGIVECHRVNTDLRGEKYLKTKKIAKEKYDIDIDDVKHLSIYDDKFNARFFYNLYKNSIIWCDPLGGWLYFNCNKWRIDRIENVGKLAIDATDELMKEAIRRDSNTLKIHASKCGSLGKIHAMVKLSKSYLSEEDSLFDRNENLFNCKNGTYNLDDNVFSPCCKTDYITKGSGVFYDEHAECTKWERFIDEIMIGNTELIKFLQKTLGYSLTASTIERVFFIFYGSGSNGKSTLLEIMLKIMGEYGMNTPVDTFVDKKNSGIPNDLARLRGARFVTAKETKRRVMLDEATVKHITGNDTVTARFLNKEFFDFKPTFKIFLATNHKPRITGTDEGIWDRIRMIPFNLRVEKDKINRKLDNELAEEIPGIFNWLIEGYNLWKKEGLECPAIIKESNKTYRDEEDEIGYFIKDECFVNKNDDKCIIPVSKFKDMLNEYTGKKYGQKTISEYMTENGFKPKNNNKIIDSKKTRCYVGLREFKISDLTEVEKEEAKTKVGWND